MSDEPFYIDDKYYYSIDDLRDEIASDDCDIEDLPEDYEITATRSKLLPIIQYKAEDMAEMADEFSEQNYDQEYDLILKAIKECCDFEKLNSMIPKLWYEMPSQKFKITKQDLL